jgi:hypothetical protein
MTFTVPRIDSGNMCTSVADNVPSGRGTAVVPRKTPGTMAAQIRRRPRADRERCRASRTVTTIPRSS